MCWIIYFSLPLLRVQIPLHFPNYLGFFLSLYHLILPYLRTEQVLIELDISTIEDYVMIIITLYLVAN